MLAITIQWPPDFGLLLPSTATAPLLPHTIYCPLRLAVVKADRGREAGKERALLCAVLGTAVPLRILKF